MSSRTPMPRPRRIAGRGKEQPVQTPPEVETPPPVVEPPVVERVATPAADTETQPPVIEAPPEPEVDTPSEKLPRRGLGGRRTTIGLVISILVLAALAMTLALYLWGPLRDEPTVSAETPILTEEVSYRSAVDAAAAASVKFTERSYETYDEQVDAATATMTDAFAKEYRSTTDQIKADFIESKTEVTAEVVAQSVRTASEEQVEALLFLNQFTTKNGEGGTATPYRVLVTMVNTDHGWLVSDVETA